jgi:RNA polymerase sigma-70 factor (ECF subfamily)
VTPLRAPADLDLAQRCCAGERAAQRALFHREKRRVHATLYRVLGSNADMDDLVQDAFIEVFKGLSGFRGDASLSTWIDRVTVRVAFAHIAKRRPRTVPLSLVVEPPSQDADAEQRALGRDALRRLYAVLERLEARQRVAWVLHVLDGRPMADVASAMDASVVLTKVRVWRARLAIEAHARRDPLLRDFVIAPAVAGETG